MPLLRDNQSLAIRTDVVTTSIERLATPADVARRQAMTTLWEEAENPEGEKPVALTTGDSFVDQFTTGGQSIFWESLTEDGETKLVEIGRSESEDGAKRLITQRREGTFQGQGRFNLDYCLYHFLGMDLRKVDKAALTSLRIPPRLIMPFVVILLLSLVSRPGSKEALDRYYVKMKTPVQLDPEEDKRELERSYASPARFDSKRMFPNTNLEIQKPTFVDITGFVVSVGICFLFIALATWLANIGS